MTSFMYTTFFDASGVCILAAILTAVYIIRYINRTRALFPPGPRPLPLIGNLHQLPASEPAKTYAEWTSKYGPLIYFHVFGRQFIILNNLEIAQELFEKRSALYSTKPRLVMAGELVNRASTSILFLPYGDRLRECRRLVHSWIGKQPLIGSYSAQEAGALKLLGALLDDPTEFSQHIRTTTGSVILKLTYGINCSSKNDPNIAMAEQLSKITAQATQPGRWLCDSFPSLAYIPPWIPGAGFRVWAEQARRISTDLVRIPFEMVKNALNDGTATKCWVSDGLLNEDGHNRIDDYTNNLMIAAGTMYSGGIDTTVSSLRTFFLMMAIHPEIQIKAQAEIDAVVGSDRLPDLQDRNALPYVNAIIAEVLRYNPVAPLVPHSLDKDDIYNDYLIPKGAWVMVNIWAILHNPTTYKSPETFRPERFYSDSKDTLIEPDPTEICFGFGRRSCPGFHFAMTSLFLNIAQILSTFNIRPVKNSKGEYESLEPHNFRTGHLRAPYDFRCSIEVRTEEKALLVRSLLAGIV